SERKIVLAALVAVVLACGVGLLGPRDGTAAQGAQEPKPPAAPKATRPAEQAQSDSAKLQGAWQVVRRVINGEDRSETPKGVGPVRLYFQGGTVYETVGERFQEEYAFTLDQGQKPTAI